LRILTRGTGVFDVLYPEMEEAPNRQVGEVLSSTLNIILLLPEIGRLCRVTCRAYRLSRSLGLENKEHFVKQGNKDELKWVRDG
jgi:hypothetical protein